MKTENTKLYLAKETSMDWSRFEIWQLLRSFTEFTEATSVTITVALLSTGLSPYTAHSL